MSVRRVDLVETFGTIDSAITEAQRYACAVNHVVILWFNDVLLPVEPDSTIDNLVVQYNTQCNWRDRAKGLDK